jgi:hypothetical protein
MCSFEQFVAAWKGRELSADVFMELAIRAQAVYGISYDNNTRIFPAQKENMRISDFCAAIGGMQLPLANPESLYPYLRRGLTDGEKEDLLGGRLNAGMLDISDLANAEFEAAARIIPPYSKRKRWEIVLLRQKGKEKGYGDEEFVEGLLAAMPYAGRNGIRN